MHGIKRMLSYIIDLLMVEIHVVTSYDTISFNDINLHWWSES